MKDKFLHRIAIALVVLFLMPSIIKVSDAVFHVHGHIYCTSKKEKHYHQNKEECAIAVFSFTSFVKKKTSFLVQILKEKNESHPNFYQSCSVFVTSSSFLLRAPPILIS